MAGVQASYDELHSSGPEESLSSYYVKVTLKDGHQVSCKLRAENPGNLPRCINCYFFITSWVKLKCRHNLCTECFKNSMTFVCTADSTETFRYQASAGSCTYEGTWKDVLIECPWCEAPEVPSSIAKHIEKEHPITQQKSRTAREFVQEPTELCGNNEPQNLSHSGYNGRDSECSNAEPSKLHGGVRDTKTDEKQSCDHQALAEYNLRSVQCRDREVSIPNQPRLPRQDEDAKEDNPETRCKDECHNRDLTSSVDRGQEFPNNEQSDLPPTAIEAKEEHEEAPSKYFIECPMCKINIYSKDFVKHEELCQGQSRNEREASPGVKQRDGNAEEQDLADQIRELKHEIKVLEDRLQEIEEPLQTIIARLFENHLNGS